MSLFKCKKCGTIENTALVEEWYYDLLCSECKTGAWHNAFPKRTESEKWFCEKCGCEITLCGGKCNFPIKRQK